MATEKIARQGLTVRHVGVVVTMALTLLTAVGIVFTAAGLCYRPVSQHFGVQTSQVSLYITFVYLGQCIGAAPMAKLFDKFNAKTVCVVAALMVVIPYMGFCVYPAIWCYWVAGFIIGLGLVCVEFTMTAGILSRWFHTNYGTVTGIVFAMTGVGGVVWNIIGQFVLGPDLQGWRTLYMVFGIAIAIGTIPFIAIFVKRTPQECGTLPYGMPLDAAAMEAELAEEADRKAIQEPGFAAKDVLKMPFFWTLVLGAGLLNTITTMSQLFATYVQFLGHEGWEGQALVALLLLSGTLEAFASAGQGGGKVLIGFIESRSVLINHWLRWRRNWSMHDVVASQAVWRSRHLAHVLRWPFLWTCLRMFHGNASVYRSRSIWWSRFRQDLLLDDHDLQWHWRTRGNWLGARI